MKVKELYKGRLPFPAPRILTEEQIRQIIQDSKDQLREQFGLYGERMEERPGLTYDARHFRHTF